MHNHRPHLLQPIKELLFVIDLEGQLIECSDSVYKMLPYKEGNLKSKSFSELVYKDDVWKLSNLFSYIKDQETQYSTELRLLKKDHMYSWFNVTGVVKEDFLVLSAISIANKKELERMLGESISRFKTVVEESPTGICITNEDGIFEYVNKGYCHVYGYQREELLGKHFSLVVPPCDRQKLIRHHEDFIRNTTVLTGEWKVVDKSGNRLTILANAAYIIGEDGRPKKVTFIMDITERKHIEDQLRQYSMEIRKQSEELQAAYEIIREDVERAYLVQRQFFPAKLPFPKDFLISAYYQPAKQLGGDYYNIIQLNEKEMVIYLSDVSGHGIDGALLNIFVKNTVDYYLKEIKTSNSGISVKSLMEYTAERFKAEKLEGDYFVCLCFGILNTENYTFTYSSAGFQTPLFLIDQKGKFSQIQMGGLPISSSIPEELNDFSEQIIKLESGMTFALLTDGLIEEEKGGRMFGIHGVEKCLIENYLLPPEFIQQNLLKSFEAFKNTDEHQDDITSIIVQRIREDIHSKRLTIQSEFSQLQDVRNFACFLCNMVEVEEFITYFLEVVINSIEHGNKFDRHKKVDILISYNDDFVYAFIEDEGEGFDWKESIDRCFQVENFNERGLGIQLARMYFDSIYFNEKGNQVSLLKKLTN